MRKQAELNRQKKENEERAKQQRDEYEDRLMKMFDRKTALLMKEQQSIEDENESLRDMIR